MSTLSTPAETRPPRLTRQRVVAGFLLAAVAMLPLADFAVTGRDPWGELGRLGLGLLAPDPGAIEQAAQAIALTLAFAVAGVALGAGAGLLLAPFYGRLPVRLFSIAVRSVHELFWAILLLQVTGISATTGVVAIALPYAGIFAKVFAEYLEEADRRPMQLLPPGTGTVSAFLYARLPLALAQLRTYTLYRLECGIRSSAVLGFIGLPTLGFQLDSFFKQGQYGAVGAILLVYFALIGSMRHWMRWRLTPLYLAAAAAALWSLEAPPLGSGLLWRFLTEDIVPAPLRAGALADPATWGALAAWTAALLRDQALPGLLATVVVAQFAVVLTGFVAIAGFPLLVPKVVGRAVTLPGHLALVVGRSSPEYLLTYVLLQAMGPSMAPAVLALGLHNGAIIAHLLGRQANELARGLRLDAPGGLNLYGYELVPRLFAPALALCLYRWEIIMRESAIVGVLGIATIGFHIDSAIAELRLDRVLLFLAVIGAATWAVDTLSRLLRRAIGVEGLRMTGSVPLNR